MNARRRHPPAPAAEALDDATPSFRSGAVARLIGMPVATLRVWERRYDVSAPALTPSGQRLYSRADVRRLGLLKNLTDRGHAIGSLAALDMRQLQAVVATLFDAQIGASETVEAPAQAPAQAPVWRLAVIGETMAERLHHRALLQRIGRPVTMVGVFESLAVAAKGLKRRPVDLLLVETASLQPDWLADVDATAPALKDVKKAVLYGFASEAVCMQLDAQGVALLRAPQPAAVVGQWLRGLAQPAAEKPTQHDDMPTPSLSVNMTSERRWSPEALTTFAQQASNIACECPQHLVELLTRLSDFETYSIECSKQGAAEAELHAYLRQTAASARVRFETALERVALHEGLLVPRAGGTTDGLLSMG
jgi:MerR family transcriptional regulator, light-induced transcriptional regulator